jgi:hypothetical protein
MSPRETYEESDDGDLLSPRGPEINLHDPSRRRPFEFNGRADQLEKDILDRLQDAVQVRV